MNHKLRILTLITIFLTSLVWGGCQGVSTANEPPSSLSEETSDLNQEPQSIPTSTSQPTEESNPYAQIQAMLRSNPPCSGSDPQIRDDAILLLDEHLRNNRASIDPEVREFYENMVADLENELSEPVVSGVRIWSMYNHGFIVKTPSITFAFDLLDGYQVWDYQLPDSVLEQIEVLYISHRHDDHRDLTVIRTIKDNGGEVVMPVEDQPGDFGTIYVSPDQDLDIAGLQTKVFDGLHGVIPVRIYQVTTPEGLVFMHTGDNQTSETLPDGVKVDILFLNAWVNEGGSTQPAIGMRNSIKKLGPRLTIPGHIQELGHHYDPYDIKGRLAFQKVLVADDVPLPGEVSFQVWGEHCDFP